MNSEKIESIIAGIFNEIEPLIETYKTSPEDWNISEGNVALCIITEEGKIFGKLFGTDKLRQRDFYNVAWKKASQVWITSHNTGDYELIVFKGDKDPEEISPIALPDLIGWVGGQKIELEEDTSIAVGFSGFRGFNDLKIVQDALKKVLQVH